MQTYEVGLEFGPPVAGMWIFVEVRRARRTFAGENRTGENFNIIEP